MLLSTASRNLAAFTVLKAFAMLLTTSTISSWVSAIKHENVRQTRIVGQVDNLRPIVNRTLQFPGIGAGGFPIRRRFPTCPTMLRTIARIDLNVLFRQVASPESCGASAPAVKDQANGTLALIQFTLQVLL